MYQDIGRPTVDLLIDLDHVQSENRIAISERKNTDEQKCHGIGYERLFEQNLWKNSQCYKGKGCQAAAQHNQTHFGARPRGIGIPVAEKQQPQYQQQVD